MQKSNGLEHTVFFIVLLCFVVVARPTAASEQAEAQIRFERGVEFVKTENYIAALDEFESSYRLHPRLSVLFNIGMCYKALYRYVEAIETFERFLSTETEPIPSYMKMKAAEAVHIMKRLVGIIQLSDLTAGSTVYINGKPVPLAKLPRLILNPGKHNLEIAKDGFETLRTDIHIASDAELTVRADLSQRKIQGEESGELGAAATDDEITRFTGTESPSLPPATQENKSRRWSPELITGLALVLASAGGFVTGGHYVNERRRDLAEATKIKNEHDSSTDSQARDLLSDRYNDLEKEVNRDKAGMIVGFSAGAAALTAGIIFIVTDVFEKRKNNAVAFQPSPGGFTLSF